VGLLERPAPEYANERWFWQSLGPFLFQCGSPTISPLPAWCVIHIGSGLGPPAPVPAGPCRQKIDGNIV